MHEVRPQLFDRFGPRLRAIRTHLDLTQSNVGEGVGTHQRTVSGWEQGDRLPSDSTFRALNRYLQKQGASAQEIQDLAGDFSYDKDKRAQYQRSDAEDE